MEITSPLRKMKQKFLDLDRIKNKICGTFLTLNCKLSKEMWDTLALAYEGTSQIRDSDISMLVH
ncbi:hypothetical protein CR513_43302, partial [Mucuna pruriens]